MKFSASIDIHKPRDTVVQYFIDPQYLVEYQDGFVRKELIEGEAGQPGAVSNMFYQYGKRDMELRETVKSNELPDRFEAFYHHKHMDNTFVATFTTIDENTTRYTMEVNYVRMNWIMPRLMAILFPGMYRKPGEKWMKNFKAFVEKQ